jgi:hypothetical protein
MLWWRVEYLGYGECLVDGCVKLGGINNIVTRVVSWSLNLNWWIFTNPMKIKPKSPSAWLAKSSLTKTKWVHTIFTGLENIQWQGCLQWIASTQKVHLQPYICLTVSFISTKKNDHLFINSYQPTNRRSLDFLILYDSVVVILLVSRNVIHMKTLTLI